MKKIDLLLEKRDFFRGVLEDKYLHPDKRIDYLSKLEEIENKITASKRGKKAKQAGGNYERTVAQILNEYFNKNDIPLDIKRTPGSGGFQKSANNDSLRGDISNLNQDYEFKLSIECKNATKWSLPAWLRQAQEDCPEGKIPVVAFHQKQVIEGGKVAQKSKNYVCIELEDLLDIIDNYAVARKVK